MKELEHPHIVRYLGTERDESTQSSCASQHVHFLEYVPGGSLAKMLQQFGSFGMNY